MQEKTAREIHEESQMEEDEITMQVMKQIADTITKHIETEYDCPSRHPELEFKVPVLDLAVWVEEIEVAAPGWKPSSCTTCVATTTSAFQSDCLALNQLAIQPVHHITLPQYTGGVSQVVPLTIQH